MTLMDDTLMSVLEDRMGALLAARRTSPLTPEAEAEMSAISQTLTRPMPSRSPCCALMTGLPGLRRYRTRFVPPESDEPHLPYDGDPAAVIAALGAARA
ncbi:hypothetical protein StrepF001_14245 [Streptomyces sp. F001]|nr:hypothetical protein StrepF001_14245 [Streptomyces sp. F001]